MIREIEAFDIRLLLNVALRDLPRFNFEAFLNESDFMPTPGYVFKWVAAIYLAGFYAI